MGFGNVGRRLILELEKFKDVYTKLAVSSRGYVVIKNQKDYNELLKLANYDQKLDKHSKFRSDTFTPQIASEYDIDLTFIVIPPSYETGEPNKSIYYGLVDQEISIITADKTVLALDFQNFMKHAQERQIYVGYRATVAAGIPVIDVAKALRNRDVKCIRGVLNATTNYILSLIEKGKNYDEAVQQAIMDKYAEPDPRIDTHGWDPAAKLAIILNVLEVPVSIKDVERIPLETVNEKQVREAIKRGKRIRYIAEAIIEEKSYSVKPIEVEARTHLASVSGGRNVVEFHLENDVITIEGPVGPAWRTARTMITDLLDYIAWKQARDKR